MSIPFNCSNTAIRVTKVDRRESYDWFLCFDMFAFSHFAPEIVARIFGLFSSRKPDWNFSLEPKAKLVPVEEALNRLTSRKKVYCSPKHWNISGVVNRTFGNRTPIFRLTSIGFGNRTHQNILPIEHNRTFGNRTDEQSNMIEHCMQQSNIKPLWSAFKQTENVKNSGNNG